MDLCGAYFEPYARYLGAVAALQVSASCQQHVGVLRHLQSKLLYFDCSCRPFAFQRWQVVGSLP